MKDIIDLRSDTVTKPSPEMWAALRALANEDLGDDFYKEDPTVIKLQKKAAEIMGKEAALLVTTGSQANLVSILANTTPGDEILLEEYSHIYQFEKESVKRIAGLTMNPFTSSKGIPDLSKLQETINNLKTSRNNTLTLMGIENTHNLHGGTVISPEILRSISNFSHDNNISLHLDGARIFNAAVTLKEEAKKFVKYADSVMFCLSKGLSCPIGSIVVGTNEFIEKAREFRKMLGGGWRQAGIIACMGLEALKPNWINRLEEDHENAKLFAQIVSDLQLNLKVTQPETNIVFVEFPRNTNIESLLKSLRENGVIASSFEAKLRFVTHYGITSEHIEDATEIIDPIFKNYLP